MKEDNNNFFVYVTTQNDHDQFSCHPKLICNEHFHIFKMRSNIQRILSRLTKKCSIVTQYCITFKKFSLISQETINIHVCKTCK